MLIVDGNILDVKNPNGETEEIIVRKIKGLSKIYENRFPLVFRYSKNSMSVRTVGDSSMDDSTTQRVRRDRNRVFLSAVNKCNVGKERASITYCTDYKADKDSGIITPKSKRIEFSGTILVDEYNRDLAFYLLYVYNNCTTIEDKDIKKVNDVDNTTSLIELIDDKAISDNNLSKIKNVTKSNDFIINANVKVLETICLKYSIKTSTDVDMMRNNIIVKLQRLDNKSNNSFVNIYNEFLIFAKKISFKEDLGIDEIIEMAISDKAIEFVSGSNQKWYYMTDKGTRGEVLCEKPSNMSKDEALKLFLGHNQDKFSEFKKTVLK